jgi:hypothetical protein
VNAATPQSASIRYATAARVRVKAAVSVAAVVFLSGCHRADKRVAQSPSTADPLKEHYGFMVMGVGARAYGFKKDTLFELHPENAPSSLREAVRREWKSSDPAAFNCTRYFGDQAPYVVLVVFTCAPATDNSMIVAFDTDAVHGFRSRHYDPKFPFSDIEPPFRDAQRRGYDIYGRVVGN